MNLSGLFDKFGKEFEPGAIIFCEFEPGNDFYLIEEGQIQISKVVKDINKTMDVLGPGDIFGEMAILEEQPRSATAVTLTKVRVLNFNRQNFVTLMTSQPQLALKLLVIFSNRIYDAKRRLMILLLDDTQAKIADTFVMLAEKKNNENVSSIRETTLDIDIDALSHWCAESTENIQPVLDVWVKMGKIDLYADKIGINNLNDFHRIANTKRKTVLGR